MLGSAGATLLGPLAGGVRAQGPQAVGEPVVQPAFELRIVLEPVRPALAESSESGLRAIRTGSVRGPLLAGTVQSGHVRWHTDTARGAVEMQLQVVVRRADGSVLEVRDRSVRGIRAPSGELSRLASATSLHVAEAQDGIPVLFVGRLDASRLPEGSLSLRAFRVV